MGGLGRSCIIYLGECLLICCVVDDGFLDDLVMDMFIFI